MDAVTAVEEQQRALVTEGDAAQAADVCRRLLRTDDNAQRVETARLVLDRLRGGGGGADDSPDAVNALLRLLGNYVAPTRALTEEILSMLYFSEHRVLLIHHLSKLTYQSKECVKLVVDAYLELLASDRALLVPILGSLADMPLDYRDKSNVIDATQSLLDAAEEEDIPAVVQSLLSMATISTAPKVAARLRAECARVKSGTLFLAIEVVGRFATAGSAAIKSFVHLIRQADALTKFDIVLLTFLIGRSAENETAVRIINSAAQVGSIHGAVVRAAVEMLLRPEWSSLLPSFVRFCSCLLAACFNNRVRPSPAVDLITVAVESLAALIDARTVVREEALTLLLTIASHPPKLLLFASSSASMRDRGFLAWKVAEVIAAQLAQLAERNPRSLSPYAHLFLDHLHGISASPSEFGYDASVSYPTHILDTLCSTMAMLTKQERGIYSLLMITIQKQLVTRPGGSSANTFASSSGSNTLGVDLRQLMAVFLTGYLLKHNVVVEARDRKSLAGWMLRLLSSASRNETLLHVIRFVRDEILCGETGITVDGASTRTIFSSSMAEVFRKNGFAVLSRTRALQRAGDSFCVFAENLADITPKNTDDAMGDSLVIDIAGYESKMRFAAALHAGSRDAAGLSSRQRECETKIFLLRELFQCQLMLCTPEERIKTLTAGFLFPVAYEAAAALSNTSDTSDSATPSALSSMIWSLVCALDICIKSTNLLAKQYAQRTPQPTRSEETHLLEAMRTQLHTCFKLQDQLERILAVQRFKIHTLIDALPSGDGASSSDSQHHRELEALLAETSVVEQMIRDATRSIQGEQPCASLFGLDLRVICLAFQDQWKQSGPALALAHELMLLRALQLHLQPASTYNSDASAATGLNEDTKAVLSAETKVDAVIAQVEGRRTVKYLASRADGLARGVANIMYSNHGHRRRRKSDGNGVDSEDENQGEQDEHDHETTAAGIIQGLMVRSLKSIYSALRMALDECASLNPTNRAVQDKLVELLAAGVSPQQLRLRPEQGGSLHREVLFRHLARQCLLVTDASLSCSGVDLVVSLVQGTNKERYVSQLCLALLCEPLRARRPSSVTSPSDTAADAADLSNTLTLDGLPVALLPNAVVAPRGGSQCSLAKYRCPSAKWRHCVYLVVGVWAFAPSASLGSLLLLRLVEEARALVASTSGKRQPHKRRRNELDERSDPSSDDDNFESMDVAVTGEHQVLKSLTTESLPAFMDAIFLCAVASFFRAAPGSKAAQGDNPFDEVCLAIDVVTSGLRVFVAAERAGLTMPVRTNQLVLRASTFITRSLRGLLLKCAAWRVQRRVDDDAGAVAHLWAAFDRASRMFDAMGKLLANFQERVMLKMQSETAAIRARSRLGQQDGSDGNEDPKTAKRKRPAGAKKARWTNKLLGKAIGSKFRLRRPIAKSEAALLPFLSHSTQELRDFLDEQRSVYNVDSEHKRRRGAAPPSYDTIGRLALGSDEFLRFCRDDPVEDLLASGVLGDWAPALRQTDDSDEDDDDEDEGEEETEDADNEDDEGDELDEEGGADDE